MLVFLNKFNHIHDHFTYYIKHCLSGYTICLNTGEGEGISRTTSSTQGTSETTLPPADTSPSAIPDIQGEPIDPADWPALLVRWLNAKFRLDRDKSDKSMKFGTQLAYILLKDIRRGAQVKLLIFSF